jgi:hypothetical protein
MIVQRRFAAGVSDLSGLYCREMVVQRRLRRLAYQTFQVCTVRKWLYNAAYGGWRIRPFRSVL